MSSTSKDKLVDLVASQLANYLRSGTINPGFIEKQLQFKGVDRFQDLETILKIHFVLSEEVVEFIEKLPRRVRRIKTESRKEVIQRKGEVRGKINWNRTLRKQISFQDESVFVCQNPSKNYNVSENLVLKKILSEIYSVLENELKTPIEEQYEWLKGLKGKPDLVNYLKGIYRRNVHVNRIKNPQEYEVSDRDISIAENSRKELYKSAASLLCKYKKIMKGEFSEEELQELLNETLILPGDTPTLFELYSVFGLLKKVEGDIGDKEFELKKITKESEEIAIFEEDTTTILFYHDSTGGMEFFERINELRSIEVNIEFLERFRRSSVKHADLIQELLGEEKHSFYSGRPDVLIEYYEGDDLVELAIGEVKYSDRKQTFSSGLKELIQYLYFAKKSDNYSLKLNEKSPGLEGILLTDKQDFLKKDEKNRERDLPFKISFYDTKDIRKMLS